MKEAAMSAPETVVCLYRVAPGNEGAFTAVLARHWPTLHSLGLVTAARPVHYRGKESDGRPLFVEIFTWKDAASVEIAHEHPAVMAVWEPMGKLTESRGGRPAMEFPHVQPLQLELA
jgi:hypothetical protein